MSIFHCSIRIISRTGGRSAIASAAYRAGESMSLNEQLTNQIRKLNAQIRKLQVQIAELKS